MIKFKLKTTIPKQKKTLFHGNERQELDLKPGTKTFAVIETMGRFIRAEAQEESPVLTGTLQRAHQDETVHLAPGKTLTTIDIDPRAYNYATRGRPVIYGQKVHTRNPWMERSFRGRSDRHVHNARRRLEDLFKDTINEGIANYFYYHYY